MKNYIITIARGFGSGGKEIGGKLAKRLGIPCYEDQILKMASDFSGINEALFNERNEKLKHSAYVLGYLRKVPFTTIAKPNTKEFVSDANLFNIQSEIIRQLAVSQSCIIIGKCADYVLRDYDNVISIYIEAPRAQCVESIVNKLGVTQQEAHKLIEQTDRYRAEYYKYYTQGGYWTNPVNYDMTLNSARVGRDQCVDVIVDYMNIKWERRGL